MKVISLINMKGGVGKTTLSTNICHCLAKRNEKKVLLIDIDPQFNSTQCLFTGEKYMKHLENKGNTIIDVFEEKRKTVGSVVGISEKQEKSSDEILPILLQPNFYILPGNLELYRIEMAAGSGKENRLKKYIGEINKKYEFDYVIIDTPPTPSVWMTSALIASDYYLIPVKPDPISYTGIELLKNVIETKRDDYDLNIKCIGLVFTMVEREDSIVYRTALTKINSGYWQTYVYAKYIQKRAEIPKYQMDGTFILDGTDASLKTALVQIVDEMTTRIDDDGK